jgi:hypothetical protein
MDLEQVLIYQAKYSLNRNHSCFTCPLNNKILPLITSTLPLSVNGLALANAKLHIDYAKQHQS